MTKQEMRSSIKRTLRGLEPAAIEAKSELIASRLASDDLWTGARAILCFLSMPREVDTSPIIARARAAGKTVAVPRIDEDGIRFVLLGSNLDALPRDPMGIPVPDPQWPAFQPQPLDGQRKSVLVVTPGLAFDRAHNRLGRGGGYYDRFLASARAARPRGIGAIGVCFAEQIVEEVPHGADDQPVDAIVTDIETIR